MKNILVMLCASFLACAALVSCGRKDERQLKDAMERFRRGDAAAPAVIAEAAFNLAVVKKFTGTPESAGGMVFTRAKDTLRVQWPVRASMTLSPDFSMASADPESGRLAFSNGKEIILFDSDGDVEIKASAPGEGQVAGVSVSKDGVILLQGGFLYGMDAGGRFSKTIDAPAVTPPKLSVGLRSVMERRGGLCAVNCGNAGTYSLSVADLAGKKIALKDFPNSSAKFGFDGESVFCLTGATGGWTLVKRAVASGKSDALGRFTGLLDVEFAGDIMAAMEEKSVTFIDLKTKDVLRAPFAYGLAGQSAGKLVMTWKGAAYLVDQFVLVEKLRALRAELPALFAPAK